MENVVVERPTEHVATVRIVRPEAKNALNDAIRRNLADVFTELGQEEDLRAIILAGQPDVFAAGADVKEFATADAIEMLLRRNHLLWRAIANCPIPVIAAVNGPALGGGCELAMHADIIIAGESAIFGQPEVRVGLMPGAGGTQRLTRAIGKFKAMLLTLTGDVIDAKTADAMGLVSMVVPDSEVEERAQKIAVTISRRPPLAVSQIKEVLIAGEDCSLDAGLMLERKAFQLLFASEDKTEGATAFIEKRHPKYSGK